MSEVAQKIDGFPDWPYPLLTKEHDAVCAIKAGLIDDVHNQVNPGYDSDECHVENDWKFWEGRTTFRSDMRRDESPVVMRLSDMWSTAIDSMKRHGFLKEDPVQPQPQPLELIG